MDRAGGIISACISDRNHLIHHIIEYAFLPSFR
jgi:hypothetical protein